MLAIDIGITAPPPIAWINLKKINQFNLDGNKILFGIFVVIPTNNEPNEKNNNDVINVFLQPYLSHNFPAIGITIVNPSKYEVIVQDILFNSPTEIPRSTTILGSKVTITV